MATVNVFYGKQGSGKTTLSRKIAKDNSVIFYEWTELNKEGIDMIVSLLEDDYNTNHYHIEIQCEPLNIPLSIQQHDYFTLYHCYFIEPYNQFSYHIMNNNLSLSFN